MLEDVHTVNGPRKRDPVLTVRRILVDSTGNAAGRQACVPRSARATAFAAVGVRVPLGDSDCRAGGGGAGGRGRADLVAEAWEFAVDAPDITFDSAP
ncbi:hypothetical protein [Streptomyces xylophagus]|uniref:hypothetical protein n=1 Tax=Streptomyces xylophagus TaxID=285514 RepID=UPI0005B7C130|nr:hypothetical protein [Streptomyces xylophagus]